MSEPVSENIIPFCQEFAKRTVSEPVSEKSFFILSEVRSSEPLASEIPTLYIHQWSLLHKHKSGRASTLERLVVQSGGTPVVQSGCYMCQSGTGIRYTKGKRAYIASDDKYTNSSNESENEVAYSCFMANHDEDEVNSIESEYDLTYDELFTICKELNDESTKLRKIVSTSKKTISTLE
ncbi:hypothetical protein MTR_0004s0300 [Medicago truncatula]|uniref:Uncharacterized protein n=1 Tax=Medicago truncatula TaxID=3880 RepID=A0A072TVS4_MEDTR|nr:hypothetical protein MTR_0004s0300 [Medicago truncatula]